MIDDKQKKQDFKNAEIEVIDFCDEIICTSISKNNQLEWGGSDEKL